MPTHDKIKINSIIRKISDQPGVYLMKDRFGGVLYVGKAKSLRRRVSSYFQNKKRLHQERPKVAGMLNLIHDIETHEVKNESEALLLEGRLIKEWKPKYNTDFVDDKRFLLVQVNLEEPLPKFKLVRFRQDDKSLYFGPFAHSGLLRKTLGEMRLKFGILLNDAQPKKNDDGTWLLYDDARAEIYGHINQITRSQYMDRVHYACAFLEGKSREWIADLKQEMRTASKDLNFERAAQLRDIIEALKKTTARTRKFIRNPIPRQDPSISLSALADALKLPKPPGVMECFDISHISGTFCVASMVHFKDGLPLRNQYRRFKIKSFVGNDDFRAMEEVVGRRYRRLHQEKKPFPDLIVVDGGRGQVGAALKAFLGQGLEPPPIIGLAKKEETVIFCDNRNPLQLKDNHPGRLLLQYIRDEAHKLANSYNAELRRKKIKESILDDFKGLGPKKKKMLWDEFRTLSQLKKASPDEMAEVEGIGLKTAEKLYQFLQSRA